MHRKITKSTAAATLGFARITLGILLLVAIVVGDHRPAHAQAKPQAKPPATPRLMVGMQLKLLVGGSLGLEDRTSGEIFSQSMKVGFGVAPFVDYHLLPFLAIGAEPEFLFGINQEDDSGTDARMINLNLRVLGGYQLGPVFPYLLLRPGYSFIVNPGSQKDAGGFVFGFGAGARYRVLPWVGLRMQLDYQLGLQQQDGRTFKLSYVQVTLGIDMAF